MAYTFRFTKEKGLIDQHEFINKAINLVHMLKNGSYIVTFEKYVEKRSIPQNSLMWMWFQCVADAFNEQGSDVIYTSRNIYDYFTFKFLSSELKIGDEYITTISKTSTLKTDEFAKFLNNVQSHSAAEFGIVLPTPDDLHFAEFYEQYKKYQK